MRELTLPASPRSVWGTAVRQIALASFAQVAWGALTVVDGEERFEFGSDGSVSSTVTVHDPAVYRAILFGGSVGAGEAFMKGHWTCDDLPALIRILVHNRAALDALEGGALRVGRFARSILARARRRNTRAGSRRNIRQHYDLSNEFFAVFLDPSMTYSSAIFDSESATLEEAQQTKLDRVCWKLDLRPSDHLLEIGTGWGALAIHAAARYGCRVTTTTVSAEQHRLATERVRAAGQSNRVEVLLQDYRDIAGAYDKLVSIEMIEAVGHEFLDDYFRACSRCLAPEGVMLLQAITIADQHHESHRTSLDFIKEHIFPGSSIPSVTSILDSTTRSTDLRLFHLEDLTSHYARTLRLWRRRLLENVDAVRRLRFDDSFLRMWEYYLAYCEGAFEERYLGSVQMLLTKPGARPRPGLPKLG